MKFFKTLIVLVSLLSIVACNRKVVTVPIIEAPLVEVAEVLPAPVERATVINIKESILFAHDSANLELDEIAKIDEVTFLMKEYPDTVIVLKGYASSDGASEYNMKLSERRAEAVKAAFLERDIEEDRITVFAKGATGIFGNLLELNRRVLIINFE